MARNQELASAATSGQVTNLDKNAFELYGEQATQRGSIVGTLLKFNKGDWLEGQDDNEVAVGTKFAACMDQLMVGWVKWVDGKPERQEMGLLTEGHTPPSRKSLGDTDETTWELDAQGKPRDPWQFSNYLLLKQPGKKFVPDQAWTFATSSRGGIGAVGELCKKYGKEMRSHPDQNPVVEVGVDSYNHPNKEFGRIKVPVLTLVGWESKKLFEQQEAAVEEPKKVAGRRR